MSERHRPRQPSLRDGRVALIRKVRLSDAAGLIELDRALNADGRGVVHEPGETPMREPAMRTRLRKWTSLPLRDGVMIVAELEGAMVGEGKIKRFAPGKIRHASHLSVGVHPAVQRLGLGRALMEELLAWARWTRTGLVDDPGVNRVGLDVFEENVRARRLYESLGFRVEGVRRRQIREPDGREHDDLAMALLLDEIGQQ